MKLSAVWILALVFSAGPLFAQKIYIDYDGSYDGNSVESFAWKETAETSVSKSNPLLHSRIVNGIEYYLTLAGARETDADPDVYVTYHASAKEEISIDTSYHGYGYPSGWGYYGRRGYGYADATSTVRKYEIGTLVVAVWDASSNKLVWRGTATNITVTDNPAKMEKKLNKALKKMVDQWRKIKERNS